MLFNSFHFAIFFPVVFLLYWTLPDKFRIYFILASSFYFYMSWNAKYIVLILFTTIISYYAAILTEKFPCLKKFILIITLISCLGVLFVFKYFNFFADSLVKFLSLFTIQLHPVTLRLLLPVGISFYTFQTLSYVIDVYRGNVKAEKNFCAYAAFVSFFPQLVAGPIERTSNLLPQIKAPKVFKYEQAMYGLKLTAWGLFKKVAIADVLAVWVDEVYGNVYAYKGAVLLIATFFFTIQIYCDFSGYSDIARGCAKMMGIDLMENFRSPYFSASIKEFWSRWHISLSTWFRDYVYIPLGGNRVGKFRHNLNLMLTFIISGLWHGANFTFVIWGAVHGAAQVVENFFTKNKHNEAHGVTWSLRVLATFTFCMFAWVFFRAQSLNEALYVFANMFSGAGDFIHYLYVGFKNIGMNKPMLLHLFILISAMSLYEQFSVFGKILHEHKNLRRLAYIMLGLVIIFFSPKGVATEFVYFQF